MKSTKRILSAILSVVMILGCLTVGFTAQASAADLVEAVAKGGKVNWKGGDVTLADTLVIKSDVEIDFNGSVITGPVDKTAIKIESGNVKLYDGVIMADNKDWKGEKQFIKTVLSYKPAISVTGGEVALDCITAVGSSLRVPNSSSVEVPIGNGINATAGTVTLDNVIAIGMKALDNTKADVTVGDAILVGVYKAANQYKDVDFQKGTYTQYETVDFLEGFLKDGVQLSPAEKKYIASATNSQGDFSVGSVIVNVKTPSFNDLTSVYNNGVLSVIAEEDANLEANVSNRYSYQYTPDYCELSNGMKAEFKLVDGQYVATFTGLEENKEFEAKANYDLSVKLGKNQKDVVVNALKTVADYAKKAPVLLTRFVKDFEDLYVKAEEYVALAYNALTDTTILTKAQRTALKPVLGLIYAVEGTTFKGSETVDGVTSMLRTGLDFASVALRGAHNKLIDGVYDDAEFAETVKAKVDAKFVEGFDPIFDTDGDGEADSVYAYTYDVEYDAKTDGYDNAKIAMVYGDAGKGLLEVFNEYYDAIKAKLYTVDANGNITDKYSFNDIGAAAEYIGDNWEGILELVEYAVDAMDKASAILNNADNNSALSALLDKLLKGANLSTYVNAFNTGVKYVHKVMDRVDEVKSSDFVSKYGDKAGYYCKRYALKAWDIVTTPDKYFEVVVENDFVNVDLTDVALNTTGLVNTNVEKKDVYVKVIVNGIGSAKINDTEIIGTTMAPVWFKYGEDIVVTPVVTDENCQFSNMVIESNGNKNVVVDGKFTAKAATNITIYVNFKAQETSSLTEVIYMTDKALNYKFLASHSNTQAELNVAWNQLVQMVNVSAPNFKDLEKKGWSLKKDGSEAVKTLAEIGSQVAAAAATEDVVIVYAIYSFDEEVEVETHKEVIKMTSAYVGEDDGMAYFDISIQLKGTKKATAAGVILTRNADYATEEAMNTSLAGTAGVVLTRVSNADCFDEGYLKPNVVYSAGVDPTASGDKPIYGRGYVVYEDGTADYTPIYTLAN